MRLNKQTNSFFIFACENVSKGDCVTNSLQGVLHVDVKAYKQKIMPACLPCPSSTGPEWLTCVDLTNMCFNNSAGTTTKNFFSV
jgi:hypothetical protein